MSRELLVATSNAGKLQELRRMLADLDGVRVVGAREVGGLPEVDEDGATFEHNARKKAREIARATGMLTLADDSGLEVDALGGAPGVFSARYAGPDADDAGNNAKLLAALSGVPDGQRTGRFVCVVALADPGGALGDQEEIARGTIEGRILGAPRGSNGFGYDPLFVPTGEARSMAELSAADKDRRSHRQRAVMALKPFLTRYLAGG